MVVWVFWLREIFGWVQLLSEFHLLLKIRAAQNNALTVYRVFSNLTILKVGPTLRLIILLIFNKIVNFTAGSTPIEIKFKIYHTLGGCSFWVACFRTFHTFNSRILLTPPHMSWSQSMGIQISNLNRKSIGMVWFRSIFSYIDSVMVLFFKKSIESVRLQF